MKIMGLRAENVKRLQLVEITPQGNVMKITGKNGHGKTSVLDSMLLALGGDAAVKLTKTSKPIHEGADKGEVALDLGEYRVTRSWIGDNTYLKVENSEGKKVSSPQQLLNNFVGNLSFDPFAFMRMNSADQVKTLQQVIGFDPKPLEERRKKVFDERTLVNRQAKELESALSIMNNPEGDLPEAEVEMKDLLDRFQQANDTLADNQAQRKELEKKRELAVAAAAHIEELEKKIAALQLELEQAKTRRAEMVADGRAFAETVSQLVDPNLKEIQEQMANISETNRKIRERKEYKSVSNKLVACQHQAAHLTSELERIDQQKADAVKNAQLPIEGLSFNDSGVIYKEHPLEQASHAEQWRVSMAMGMALNPTLRVMFIKDGEKFDSDSWKMIEEMAEKNDYQLWVELVEESGNVGVYIEDGMVKAYAEANA